MTWSSRTRDEIRDSFLEDWGARATDARRPIATGEGSYAWFLAGALALILESQEAKLDDLGRQILPDTATTSYLDRHGAVDGVARQPAVKAVLQVTVTGVALATVTFGSATLTAPDGNVFVPSANADGTGTSVVLDGSGNAAAYVTARTAGAAGNEPALTTLTWSATPANANPTLQVAAVAVDGEDAESDASYAVRIIQRRQERPASGNRSDWQDWAVAVDGVDDAVVYPLWHPTFGPGTLGAVTVIPLGPPQGDNPDNSRVVSSPVLSRVGGYIEGFNDATGSSVKTALLKQLRPVTMASGDFAIVAATLADQSVELQCVFAAPYKPPFAYDATILVLASPAPTTTSFDVAGDKTATITTQTPLLVNANPNVYRGAYYQVTPTAVSYDGGSGQTTVTVPAMPAAAVVGSVVLPAPPAWTAIRQALMDLFDQLGPGDTSPPARWPGEDSRLRATLYRSALIAALVAQYDADGALHCGVVGTLGVTVLSPGSDITPAAGQLVTSDVFMVHE